MLQLNDLVMVFFSDGLTSPGAVTLTFQSSSINQGSGDPYYHPDIYNTSVINGNAVNIMTVQDCFLVMTPDKVEFTAQMYTPNITEA